ncbi:MAG: SEC-C metal-binding domain-containing protein, partial [Longimicrobiales bacterium]
MTGRNDPCPCASGRKYKHCCQTHEFAAGKDAADPDADTVALPEVNQHVRAAAARAECWQVEAIPVPVEIESERDARPVAVLVVAEGYLLHSRLRARLGGETADVAAALELGIAAAARRVGTFPAAVAVRHTDVGEALRARLQARGIAVHAREALPELQDAAVSLRGHMAGQENWPPTCVAPAWSAWGLPEPLLRKLFAAAASFWHAAPWKTADNSQAPRVVISTRAWTACVLGNGGEEFGLALYSDERDLYRMMSAQPGELPFSRIRGRVLSLTYETGSD